MIVGCPWVFKVKVVGSNRAIDRLKASLYGIDYRDTFLSVAKMASVRLLISMAAMKH